MVSRENRVLIGSLLAVWLAVIGIGLTGIGAQSAVVTFVVLAGIGIIAPQLYLAVTDADVSPERRVRIAVMLAIVIAMLGFGRVEPLERGVIGALVAALFVALVAFEFASGYRETAGKQ
ncbi:hypothetical protein [Natronorubrum aibiense]|uniref:Uncharacterized protein n=1 Tax=Natronorubrum aibiense TaxID=348826 RepID=A0A5P9NZ16_9EURY|nr:hypothetical protein [Natronorubrum aibiense]QFU81148.1 hypothetical protein GCU68_00560 [Natronorubrum aibiense]